MKDKQKINRAKRQVRKKRIRAKISGTKERPRLSVAKSIKHIYVQIINDETKKTLVAAHDKELKGKLAKLPKTDKAKELGKLIAEKAVAKKINKVVFDRRGHPYHGRIKAVAEGARKAGLKF